MSQTFLYRLFGIGKVPKKVNEVLRLEGVILQEEGLSGSITYRNFKAPGKRFGYKKSWFSGSLTITEKRFVGLAFSRFLINIPLEEDKFSALDITVEGQSTLLIAFDPSVFDPQQSGQILCKFHTPKAQLYLERLTS